MYKSFFLTLLFNFVLVSNLFSQLPDGQSPGRGWKDSYQANGLCWCDSTFDHDLDDITKVSFVINGIARNIRDICDELQYHPLMRDYSNGDPVYNDIQCGNGPANTAIDEVQCPGRVDLGSDGCLEIGPTWDIEWLASRSRFGGDDTDNTTQEEMDEEQLIENGIYYLESPFLNERLMTTTTHNGEMAASANNDQQKWTFNHLGNNVYTILNVLTNRYLEVPKAICEDQANVGTWVRASDTHQQWKIATNGDGYNLMPLHCSTKSLDRVVGASEANIVIHNASTSNKNQLWNIVGINADTTAEVTILGETIKKFVTIQTNSPNYVIANSTTSYATFTMESLGGDAYAFKGENGFYLSSENGQSPVTCNRNAIGSFETFILESLGGNIYAIKGNNGLYLSHERGRKAMNCNRSAIGPWERFVINGVAESKNLLASSSFKAYPNPIQVEDVLNIQIQTSAATDATAALFSISGQLIAKEEFNFLSTGLNTVPLQKLQNAVKTSGVYILTFTTKEKKYSKLIEFY